MKFSKVVRLLGSIVVAVSGWLMVGVGYGTPSKDLQLNTVFLCLGILLFIIGVGEFGSILSSSSSGDYSANSPRTLHPEERKFGVYLTILRFLPFTVTGNLRRMYLDFGPEPDSLVLTAFYETNPDELELRLFDEVVIKASAHIQDFSLENTFKLLRELGKEEKHDFTVFAVYGQP